MVRSSIVKACFPNFWIPPLRGSVHIKNVNMPFWMYGESSLIVNALCIEFKQSLLKATFNDLPFYTDWWTPMVFTSTGWPKQFIPILKVSGGTLLFKYLICILYWQKENSLHFFLTSHNNSSNCYFGSDFLWPKLFFNPKNLFDPKSSSTEISSVEVYAQLVVSWVCRNETATLAPVFRLEPWTLGWKRCSWSEPSWCKKWQTQLSTTTW